MDIFRYLRDVDHSSLSMPGAIYLRSVVAIRVTLTTLPTLASQSAMMNGSNMALFALVGFGFEAFLYGAFFASAGKTS